MQLTDIEITTQIPPKPKPKKKNKPPTQPLRVALTPEQHARFKQYCKIREVTMTKLVKHWITLATETKN